MCQAVVRRLFNPSERCHVRKVARLLAQALSHGACQGGVLKGEHSLGHKGRRHRRRQWHATIRFSRDRYSALYERYADQLNTSFLTWTDRRQALRRLRTAGSSLTESRVFLLDARLLQRRGGTQDLAARDRATRL
jgi:hypothetical protein